MIYKRMIPMAQSKYILATYSPKPGQVNKHWILSPHILATYSQKPGRVNKHRILSHLILATYSHKPGRLINTGES